MTRDEERSLAILAQRGDQRAFERLLNQWEPLIRRMARYYHMKRPSTPLEDIEQVGRLGFWEALGTFRDIGGKPSSHCLAKSRWAMGQMVRDEGRMKRSTSTQDEHILDAIDHRLDDDGFEPGFLARLDLSGVLGLVIPRHREILEMVIVGHTHQDIADRYGFSRARAQRIKESAVEQIRKKLRRAA